MTEIGNFNHLIMYQHILMLKNIQIILLNSQKNWSTLIVPSCQEPHPHKAIFAQMPGHKNTWITF